MRSTGTISRRWYFTYEEYHPYGTSAYRAEAAGVEVSRRRYRYTGKERDEETGLYYHGARYYAAWLGRWTAADPSGVDGGINLYEYVAGNPIALSDPDGRRPKADGIHASELENRFWRGAGEATLKRGIMEIASMVKAAGQGDHIERKGTAARERDDEVAGLVNERAEETWQSARNSTVTNEEVAAGESALTAVELTFAAFDLARAGIGVLRVLRNLDDVAEAGAKVTKTAGNKAAQASKKVTNPFDAPAVQRHVKPGTAAETAEDLAGARPPYGAPPPPRNPAKNLSESVSGSYGELKRAGQKDAHHIIQDAAVRDLPGYSRSAAPSVQLPGPSTKPGTPHHRATKVQRQAGGGSYASERRIAYKALRRAGIPEAEARHLIQHTDDHFGKLGVSPTTVTRIPGNRRK